MENVAMAQAAHLARATTLLDQVGNTPLIHLQRVAGEHPGVEIYGKAEAFNPGGSVKDRPALNMIRDGERTGRHLPAGGAGERALPERVAGAARRQLGAVRAADRTAG